jgi:hypothetical protein
MKFHTYLLVSADVYYWIELIFFVKHLSSYGISVANVGYFLQRRAKKCYTMAKFLQCCTKVLKWTHIYLRRRPSLEIGIISTANCSHRRGRIDCRNRYLVGLNRICVTSLLNKRGCAESTVNFWRLSANCSYS